MNEATWKCLNIINFQGFISIVWYWHFKILFFKLLSHEEKSDGIVTWSLGGVWGGLFVFPVGRRSEGARGEGQVEGCGEQRLQPWLGIPVLPFQVTLTNSQRSRKGAGPHMPGQHGQGQNPDFLMPTEVFLPENLVTVLYLVIVNPRATAWAQVTRMWEAMGSFLSHC